jgi:hypothetical protein
VCGSPETARGLEKLLHYEGPGDVSDVFGLNFEAAYDSFGSPATQVQQHAPVLRA